MSNDYERMSTNDDTACPSKYHESDFNNRIDSVETANSLSLKNIRQKREILEEQIAQALFDFTLENHVAIDKVKIKSKFEEGSVYYFVHLGLDI